MQKQYTFRAYQSGDWEEFCFAVPPEDIIANGLEWGKRHTDMFHVGMIQLYPSEMLPVLPHDRMYQFRIIVEDEPYRVTFEAVPIETPPVAGEGEE